MKNSIKQVENFLEELSLKKSLSSSTIIAYEKDLNDYIDYMKTKELNIFELNEKEYKEYFDFLKTEFKISSFRRKYSSIKNFYKYLWKNKLVTNIFEYDLDNENTNLTFSMTLKSEIKKIDYQDFINSLGNNFYDTRLKIVSMLVAELNINLANIFEIQIKDLIKYNFKKIVVNRNHKIYDYDLNENIEKTLRDYYEKYAFEKRFLFSTYNIQAFRNDLKKYNLNIANLKVALVEDEETMYKNIKKKYFEIGIGDNE